MQADKAISSLLFSSEMGRDAVVLFSGRLEELARRKRYSHSVPALESTELKNGSIKCVLDFTDSLDNSLEYGAALDQFLLQYERLLCDIILLEKDGHFRLSALVNIDPKLAAFELRAPRIPSELSLFQSFSFDFWVWHASDARPC